ncbi:uncharacterized protein LOC111366981 [Olea europaea var. sylvestris]|uniref:uncharacterized protein LOC111366981 n=1 Tax=Olea europaea var. sylvestris TaxID=158386 RepID=UPI000C1CD546|nr:uncharacterized protein LOC111366981 [Olea europaea var. sylvestris]
MEIKDLKELKWPPRMQSLPENRDKTKRDVSGSYTNHEKRSRNNKNNIQEGCGSEPPTAGTINVIVGGTTSGGDTNSGHKQYARQLPASSNIDLAHTKDITFGSKDLEGISFPHDDALVISAVIANFEVKRILVDNGSAANVLSHEAFVQIGISVEQLKPVKTPLQGFGGGVITPEGIVGLPMTLGSEGRQLSELELELENRGRLTPVEELVKVELEPGRKVIVGRDLDLTIMAKLISCLSQNQDVLALTVEDMPRIDPEDIVHRLNANGKWRVCIDFTDLNEACPKDSYPLPRSDSLIDSTSSHKLYSFLDAFSRYHQIPMATEDQEKTSFMADSAIYCYKAMPFGLKNVDNHITDLKEVFSTLRKYNMELNPTKCAFGVASGKFLGFMITNRGIEANPDKIQALISMEAPKTKKKIQKLIGRVATLNRFISRAANRCFPFFKVLRGNQSFEWNDECDLAFQQLKQTLAVPPVLAKPEPGDTLFLYLVISRNAVSGVLVKEKGKVQQPICYVSKVLLDTETRYTLAKQLALAFIVTTRKLWQYFQSHPIIVLTNQPLKHILQRPDVSRRLLRWAIELGEFDIEFKPRPSIKAQTLADFIAELTPKPQGPKIKNQSKTSKTWEIFVDGASNSSGSGVGIIIISLDKVTEVQCALRFEFEATNNEAEYKAMVIALELARSLELEHIRVFSDSQLRQFTSCEILKIARAYDSKADALSRLVFMRIDGLDRAVHIKIVKEPSINTKPSVMDIDHEPSWIDPIVEYISNGNLPPDPRIARSIRAKVARYCIIRGVLFRRCFTLPYLRCLKPFESLQALTEVHEGICGNHQGARALTYKLTRYGYYWPTIKKDTTEYAKRCDKC